MYADIKHGNCLVTSGIFLVPKQTAVWSVSIQPILFLSELECKQTPCTRPTGGTHHHIITLPGSNYPISL